MISFFHKSITTKNKLLAMSFLMMTGSLVLFLHHSLPLALGDFLFFSILLFLAALYRMSFVFLVWIAFVPFEIVTIAPAEIGFLLRPYQWFGVMIMMAFVIRFLAGRFAGSLPRWHFVDTLLSIVWLASLWTAFHSASFAANFKQVMVLTSCLMFYALTRIMVRGLADVRRVAVFVGASSMVVGGYALWQQVRFMQGGNAFEVMAGRPNSVFAEPDWLGAFALVCLAIAYAFGMRFFETNFALKKWQAYGWWSVWLVSIWGIMLLTVARSAWLGAGIMTLVAGFEMMMRDVVWFKVKSWQLRRASLFGVSAVFCLGLSFVLIGVFHLTSFSLVHRAESTASGQQLITVACDQPTLLPERIDSIDELSQFSCKHILLEEKEAQQAQGKTIEEVLRKDPSIMVRRGVYETTKVLLGSSWINGIGFASIGEALGRDERGAGLNASNIFFEVWLGSGVIGGIAFALMWFSVGFFSFKNVFVLDGKKEAMLRSFLMLSWVGLSVFNLFNAGIFLGFLWVWLAIAVTFILKKI